MRLGFIGAGNMASAIIGGVIRSGFLPAGDVYVFDTDQKKVENLLSLGLQAVSSNAELAKKCDCLLLAVKPQMIDLPLDEISNVNGYRMIVSIAAGVSSQYIASRLECKPYIVRVMPNAPLMFGSGATAISENVTGIPDDLYRFACGIFESSGVLSVIPEAKMDVITSVNGSSPAYFFRMIRAMADSAENQGIDRETATKLAAASMLGSAKMILEFERSVDDLIQMITSPGGTTLAALTAFDEKRFDELIDEAMRRCTRRSRELGKK